MSARAALSAVVVSTLLLAGVLSPSGTAQVQAPARDKHCKATEAKLVRKVYQVMDLVVPIAPQPCPASARPECRGPTCTMETKARQSPMEAYLSERGQYVWSQPTSQAVLSTQEDMLISLIKTTIAPTQWSDAGGPCTVEFWPLTGALVVNAPPAMQEQLSQLLTALRRLQDREVALEVRFISIDEALYERLSIETGMRFGKKDDGPLAVLDDKQVARLIDIVQADRHTHVMQAPKVTLLDGQTANCCVGEDRYFTTQFNLRWDGTHIWGLPVNEHVRIGLDMALLAALSADNRYVDVGVDVKQTELESDKVALVPVVFTQKIDPTSGEPVSTVQSFPSTSCPSKAIQKPEDKDTAVFTQFVQAPKIAQHSMNKKLVLADGKTAVLYGWKRHVEREDAVPILSELPLIGQHFKRVQPGVETVLVMVTPRVLIEPEEEERTTGLAVPPVAASPAKVAPKAIGDSEESETAANLDELLAKYHKACAAGKLSAARKLAIKALTLDPACFDMKR